MVAIQTSNQSAGRGRRGAEWRAPSGSSLLITYILSGSECHPAQVHIISFIAGLAVAEGIEELCGISTLLKWPNDVFSAGKKIAGILIETAAYPPPNPDPVALLGIGVNVNTPSFPHELSETATSLLQQTGREWDITPLEECIRAHLNSLRDQTRRNGSKWLLDRWRERDDTTGRKYTLERDGSLLRGIARGVDDDGALLVNVNGRTICTLSATSADSSDMHL